MLEIVWFLRSVLGMEVLGMTVFLGIAVLWQEAKLMYTGSSKTLLFPHVIIIY